MHSSNQLSVNVCITSIAQQDGLILSFQFIYLNHHFPLVTPVRATKCVVCIHSIVHCNSIHFSPISAGFCSPLAVEGCVPIGYISTSNAALEFKPIARITVTLRASQILRNNINAFSDHGLTVWGASKCR